MWIELYGPYARTHCQLNTIKQMRDRCHVAHFLSVCGIRSASADYVASVHSLMRALCVHMVDESNMKCNAKINPDAVYTHVYTVEHMCVCAIALGEIRPRLHSKRNTLACTARSGQAQQFGLHSSLIDACDGCQLAKLATWKGAICNGASHAARAHTLYYSTCVTTPSHPPTVSATHSLRTQICWVASTPFNPWLLTHAMFTVASTEEVTAMLMPDLHP